jgi:hypothetical protein
MPGDEYEGHEASKSTSFGQAKQETAHSGAKQAALANDARERDGHGKPTANAQYRPANHAQYQP